VLAIEPTLTGTLFGFFAGTSCCLPLDPRGGASQRELLRYFAAARGTKQASSGVRNWLLTWVVIARLLSNPTSPLKRALAAYRQMDLSHPAPKPTRRPISRTIHRLTAVEIDQAIAGYQAGSTLRELGTRFGVSRHAISRNLKARGVQIRLTSMVSEEIEAAAALYASGLSLAQIGSQLGYDATTVHLALRAAGVQMRDTHGRDRASDAGA
jgi:HAMP domain-containing protein